MTRVLPLLALAAVTLGAADYRKHNVALTVGAGNPRGDLRDIYSTSFGAGGTYGYRPLRYVQVEAGYESIMGAARVRDFMQTQFGSLRIRDYQQFIPFGGRVILPLADDRVQIYGGGGGAYFRYSERVRQPYRNYGYSIDCPTCAVRDGLGSYALAGVNFALDAAQMFRLGVGTKMYRGSTSGDPLGGVPGVETTDRWLNVFATLGISF